MSKINIDKTSDFEAVRAARQSNIQSAGKNKIEPGGAKTETGADKLELSERATEVGKMIDRVKQMPDVREAKVSTLREQIAAGEFNPSGELIADAVLKDEQ